MVGQIKLLEKLNTFNIDTFPQTSLILGEKGSGKHILSKYIADNILHLSLIDISNNISKELIDNIYLSISPAIYLIDITELTEKEQNLLLKFIEEPLKNSFILIIGESSATILPTVLNRAVIFNMLPYSREELKSFVDSELLESNILDIVRTPGKLLALKVQGYSSLYQLCITIVEKLKLANYQNTLSIGNKINFKDMFDKFDLEIFLDLLLFLLFSYYNETGNSIYYEEYLYTSAERKKLLDKRLNKELFFEHFISNLWKIARKEV